MKRLCLLVLMAVFVFAAGIGEVYAGAVTLSGGTAGTNGSTGTISIASGTFARQSANLSFTTSNNVYVGANSSAATSAENYTVTAGHLSGDKCYGMDSTGGPVYARTKTAGSSTITAAPTASATGSADWSSGWTSQ